MLPENRSCMAGSGSACAQRADAPSPALAQSASSTLAVETKELHPQIPKASGGSRAAHDANREAMEKAAELFSDGPFWEVIAGVGGGGIAVKDTADSTSSEIGKLAHGSVVKQAGSRGGYLYYELVAGSGPRSGWVSLKRDG